MLVAVLIIVMALASGVLLIAGLGNRRKGSSWNSDDSGYFPDATNGSSTGETHHHSADCGRHADAGGHHSDAGGGHDGGSSH